MADAKKRTVHFFEPVRAQPDGTEIELQNDFWSRFRAEIKGLDTDEQFVTIRGVQYRGAARHCVTNLSDYLYLGKTRDTIDHPESSVGDDDEQPLILEDGGRLVEPCYLYCVEEPKNVVASLRSSGGPSITAVEEWLTKILKKNLGNDAIKLRPIVRHDQLDRLEQAQNVARFSIKLEKDKHPQGANDGAIASAVSGAYESLGQGATMTYEWSYGNSTPDKQTGKRLVNQIKQILNWGATKSAEATIIREGENGDLIRDQIDFVRDKVTFKVPVGTSPNIVQSADVVTDALLEASKKYRELRLP
ncbi:UNVERIFIED_ORG: hypothetical protein M2328_005939 [Rhodococcus erythropolis]